MAGHEPAIAQQCLDELKLGGFAPEADTAQTPSEVRNALSTGPYDVVLISQKLNAADGRLSLEAHLRETTPFILIGASEASGRAASVRQGRVEVLSPHDLQNLPLAVDRALEIKALREEKSLAEERYRMLFERNLAGVYQASMDGQFLNVNETCAHMFACQDKDKAKGCSLRGIAASPEEYDRLMGPLLATGNASNLELHLRRSNGELFWALANASVLQTGHGEEPVIEGTLIEITEWKLAQEAVAQSEKRFRALVENSTDAISLVDAAGKVISSSHAVSPIFGYSLEERVGKNIFELIHSEDLQEIMPLFSKLLSEPSSSVTTQVRYRHRDGSWRWIEALGTNLLEDPSVRAVVINYRDITERRLLLQQLFQAQKMEAVGRLAGGVAHDFNNLLTAILGYSDMVLEKLPRNSLSRRYTVEIKKAGERAASLTRQLLAFSRLQVMSPQVIDLNAAIADLSKMLRRLIGEDISFEIVPGPALGRIKADPTQIEQVIMNLAVNARDAMPEGGELLVKTSNVALEEAITPEGIRIKGGAYVLLEVADTGSGMDTETKSRVFEPFFTTKEKGKGTGLGLSTVYGIVKQSGGYIWATSDPGQGTSFKIYLPAVQEDVSVAKPQGHPEHAHHGSETILVVEDEDSVRILLGRLLRNMGYEVLESERGDTAIELGQGWKKMIHLMLTDIAMPFMNGQELARKFGEFHPETKVLFMTGYAGNKVGSMTVLEQDSHFIHKPFTADALGQKIRKILDATS